MIQRALKKVCIGEEIYKEGNKCPLLNLLETLKNSLKENGTHFPQFMQKKKTICF